MIDGPAAAQPHDADRLSLLAVGMQVRRLAVAAVGHLDTQLLVKRQRRVRQQGRDLGRPDQLLVGVARHR